MRCPRCGSEFDITAYDSAGMVTCRCGHRAYAGFLAEAASLDTRRDWLAARIGAGDPAPEPALAAQWGVWPPPAGAMSPPAGAMPPMAGTGPGAYPTTPRPAPSAQTLLLGVGALLLVVAGAVFAAVVWERLGAAGQVVLMLGATLGVGGLAAWLRPRLSGTAEALAVVAAGLAVIDLLAAPALGLLPESWLTDPTLYPALALLALGLGLLGLHARFQLGAWRWIGWLLLPLSAGVVVPAVATATGSDAWTAAAVALPTVASVAILAARRSPRLHEHRMAMALAGWAGLLASALATASAATANDALPGALLTTVLAAGAVGFWARVERVAAPGSDATGTPGSGAAVLGAPAPGGSVSAGPVSGGPTPGGPASAAPTLSAPIPAPRTWGLAALLPLATAALVGAAVGMALAIPPDPQPVWLAAIVAVGGLGVGLSALAVTSEPALAVAGSAAAWASWAWLRVTAMPAPEATLQDQLSLLAALVAVVALVTAWWLPWTAWAGALLGMTAAALSPYDPADLVAVEAYALPFAALLLLAGILWRRQRPGQSLYWLGPAVAMALIPPALATWLAPWAWGEAGDDGASHLIRLGAVLVLGVAGAAAGARLRLGGLLLPSALALIIAALAQLVSGLSNLPRWLGLGIAGVLLIVAGARLEALRRQGRRAATWVGELR